MLFLMKESLISFLDMTAWRMETPQLFGGFHLCVLVITAAAAVCAAVYFSRTVADKSKTASGIPAADGRLVQLLFVCGCVLAVLEVYKQLFLYYVVNGEAYDLVVLPFPALLRSHVPVHTSSACREKTQKNFHHLHERLHIHKCSCRSHLP